MMSDFNITVQYFAILAERVGCREETRSCAVDSTVATLLDALATQHQIVKELRDVLAVAVNDHLVGPEHAVQQGDCVGLLPPVSGG
jgi:molybdopterin converting factor subunit 1